MSLGKQVAAAGVVLAALGGGVLLHYRSTPESGAGNGLIVAYEAGNHLHRYGARVYSDGRYEQFSTSHPGETPHWERFDPFGERSTGAIADAVDAALAARIPDQISAGDPPPPDAAW